MRRMMVADLDSINQAERWVMGWCGTLPLDGDRTAEAFGHRGLGSVGVLRAAGMRWFSGVLRTADLVSDTILVTDAQLLDGAFFASLGPSRVRSLLGRAVTDTPSLTVLGRGPTLEESLREMVVGPAGATTFTWSVLGTFLAAGTSSKDRLTAEHADRILSAGAGTVTEAINAAWIDSLDSQADADSVRHLTAMWQAWVLAEQAGLVAFERYAQPPSSLWGECAARWARPSGGAVLGALLEELARTPQRSAALRLLDATERGGRVAVHERLWAEAWYLTVYADFVARNNGADWIDITGSRLSDHPITPVGGGSTLQVTLRGAAPRLLDEMPPAQFEVFRYRARSAIADYRLSPTQRALDRIAYAVQRESTQTDLDVDRRATFFQLMISCLALVLVSGVGLVQAVPGWAVVVPLAILALSLFFEWVKMVGVIRQVSRSPLTSVITISTAGRGVR